MSVVLKLAVSLTVAVAVLSCGRHTAPLEAIPGNNSYAELFAIDTSASGNIRLISISPFDNSADSLEIFSPFSRIICMSATSAAALDALGEAGSIVGISGIKYISSPTIRNMEDSISDVGYEDLPDYEKIISLKPDILLAYQTSAAIPAYIDKLRSLGIRVMMVYDHMESHPLARAEYIRFHACLVGKVAEADSIYNEVRRNYTEIAASSLRTARPVLMNTPYSDQWFIPGKDSYMYHLIEDAGGMILGAREGRESSVISIEQAFSYSREAEFWLHPEQASSIAELKGQHPLFASFPVISRPDAVWSNNLQSTIEGGNDFWERGAIRPDLILRDLSMIFREKTDSAAMNFYKELTL